MKINYFSGRLIGLSIEVHRNLGPGLLESVYKTCLSYELVMIGLSVKQEVKLPVRYKRSCIF